MGRQIIMLGTDFETFNQTPPDSSWPDQSGASGHEVELVGPIRSRKKTCGTGARSCHLKPAGGVPPGLTNRTSMVNQSLGVALQWHGVFNASQPSTALAMTIAIYLNCVDCLWAAFAGSDGTVWSAAGSMAWASIPTAKWRR
jgi:hypothetical protein